MSAPRQSRRKRGRTRKALERRATIAPYLVELARARAGAS
jgi:hypothetical protein